MSVVKVIIILHPSPGNFTNYLDLSYSIYSDSTVSALFGNKTLENKERETKSPT